MNLLRRSIAATGELLFSPSRFFEKMPLEGGVLRPVAYALVIQWIASATAFGWKQAVSAPLRRYLPDLRLLVHDAHELGYPEGREAQYEALWRVLARLKELTMGWFWGVGSVWASPLMTLAGLAWTALMLGLAALLLLPGSARHKVSWRGSLRLACFCSAPALWSGIPVVGPAIHHVMGWVTTWIALKKVYEISFLRALMLALFPQLLLLASVLLALGYLGILAFRAFGPLLSGGSG